MLTKYISNSEHIWADSAQMDWSNAVQASSVQVTKNWGLVRALSKNFSDWIGLDLDGPGPDWSIAGLVESLLLPQQMRFGIMVKLAGSEKIINPPQCLTKFQLKSMSNSDARSRCVHRGGDCMMLPNHEHTLIGIDP